MIADPSRAPLVEVLVTIFFVIGAAHRQRLQRWALVSEPLGRPGIAAADDLVDKPAAGSQPVEIARTAHQERIFDRLLSNG
ncbi:MAG: hypothetical protein WBX30_29785 [Stellaceae bacterium]